MEDVVESALAESTSHFYDDTGEPVCICSLF